MVLNFPALFSQLHREKYGNFQNPQKIAQGSCSHFSFSLVHLNLDKLKIIGGLQTFGNGIYDTLFRAYFSQVLLGGHASVSG